MPRRLTNSTLLLYGVRNLSVNGTNIGSIWLEQTIFYLCFHFASSLIQSKRMAHNPELWLALWYTVNKKVLWVLNHEVEKRHTFHQKKFEELDEYFSWEMHFWKLCLTLRRKFRSLFPPRDLAFVSASWQLFLTLIESGGTLPSQFPHPYSHAPESSTIEYSVITSPKRKSGWARKKYFDSGVFLRTEKEGFLITKLLKSHLPSSNKSREVFQSEINFSFLFRRPNHSHVIQRLISANRHASRELWQISLSRIDLIAKKTALETRKTCTYTFCGWNCWSF